MNLSNEGVQGLKYPFDAFEKKKINRVKLSSVCFCQAAAAAADLKAHLRANALPPVGLRNTPTRVTVTASLRRAIRPNP